MKKAKLIIILIILISHTAISQSKVKIEKSEFKLEKDGFEEAWGQIKDGEKYFNLGGGLYPEAARHYLKAYEFNSENAQLNYKIGVSCLLGNDQYGALNYLLKSRSLDMDVAEDILLLTGRAYQFRGDYGKAIDCYNMYSDKTIEQGKPNPLVPQYIKECNMGIDSGEANENIEILNLGKKVNSSSDDYSPILIKDEQLLYFTSRRPVNDSEELLRYDNKPNENIFLATTNGENWSEAGPAGKELATSLNEGVLFVDNENNYMLVYAGWIGNGDILISNFDKGEWTKPDTFRDETSTVFRETSIALTRDGDEIYFTSDSRKSNQGGRDIYYIKRIKKNKWTKPFNLGPTVNSGGNEEAVWTSATGDTIWFSSNGLQGYGGYDIFMSVRDENGLFSEAVNMGLPINSQWNDLFYRPSLIDRRKAYFSSNRPNGMGGLDIYLVRPLSPGIPKTEASVIDY